MTIETELIAHLHTNWVDSETDNLRTRILMENTSEKEFAGTYDSDSSHIIPFINVINRTDRELPYGTGHVTFSAIFNVDVYTPVNEGKGVALDYLAVLDALYDRKTISTTSFILNFETSIHRNGFQHSDKSHYVVPWLCNFFVFA